MKNAALAALALLSACATHPTQYRTPAGVNVARECHVMPMTRYMWEEAYISVLNTQAEPDWLYPAAVGWGTVAWLAATPFVPVMDMLTSPLRATQECTWENTGKSLGIIDDSAPAHPQPASPPHLSP
jgi:hypothetical protein